MPCHYNVSHGNQDATKTNAEDETGSKSHVKSFASRDYVQFTITELGIRLRVSPKAWDVNRADAQFTNGTPALYMQFFTYEGKAC